MLSRPVPESSQSQSAVPPVQTASSVPKPASEEPVKPSAPISPSESRESGAMAAPPKLQEAANLFKEKLVPSKPLFEEPSSQTKHDLPRKEAEVKPAEKASESGTLMVAAGVVGLAALGLAWLWARSRK